MSEKEKQLLDDLKVSAPEEALETNGTELTEEDLDSVSGGAYCQCRCGYGSTCGGGGGGGDSAFEEMDAPFEP